MSAPASLEALQVFWDSLYREIAGVLDMTTVQKEAVILLTKHMSLGSMESRVYLCFMTDPYWIEAATLFQRLSCFGLIELWLTPEVYDETEVRKRISICKVIDVLSPPEEA